MTPFLDLNTMVLMQSHPDDVLWFLCQNLSHSGKTRKDHIIEYTAVSCPKALDFTEIVVRSTAQGR